MIAGTLSQSLMVFCPQSSHSDSRVAESVWESLPFFLSRHTLCASIDILCWAGLSALACEPRNSKLNVSTHSTASRDLSLRWMPLSAPNHSEPQTRDPQNSTEALFSRHYPRAISLRNNAPNTAKFYALLVLNNLTPRVQQAIANVVVAPTIHVLHVSASYVPNTHWTRDSLQLASVNPT